MRRSCDQFLETYGKKLLADVRVKTAVTRTTLRGGQGGEGAVINFWKPMEKNYWLM